MTEYGMVPLIWKIPKTREYGLGTAGCYHIYCPVSKIGYVGSSNNIRTRLRRHLYDLKRGRHSVRPLQKIFDSGEQLTIRVLPKREMPTIRGEENYWLCLEERELNGLNTLRASATDKTLVRTRGKGRQKSTRRRIKRWPVGQYCRACRARIFPAGEIGEIGEIGEVRISVTSPNPEPQPEQLTWSW